MRNDSVVCRDEYITIAHKVGFFNSCGIEGCVKYFCVDCLKFSGSDCGLENDDI